MQHILTLDPDSYLLDIKYTMMAEELALSAQDSQYLMDVKKQAEGIRQEEAFNGTTD